MASKLTDIGGSQGASPSDYSSQGHSSMGRPATGGNRSHTTISQEEVGQPSCGPAQPVGGHFQRRQGCPTSDPHKPHQGSGFRHGLPADSRSDPHRWGRRKLRRRTGSCGAEAADVNTAAFALSWPKSARRLPVGGSPMAKTCSGAGIAWPGWPGTCCRQVPGRQARTVRANRCQR